MLIQFALTAVGAALTAPAASPAHFDTAEDMGNGSFGFISMPITRKERARPTMRKRDNDVPLYNVSSVSYLIERTFFPRKKKLILPRR